MPGRGGAQRMAARNGRGQDQQLKRQRLSLSERYDCHNFAIERVYGRRHRTCQYASEFRADERLFGIYRSELL